MHRFASILCAWVAFGLAPLACQPSGPGDAEDVAVADSAAAEGAEEHEHSEEDSLPPIPTRESELTRDEGEHPQAVMAELGIGPGAQVADVMAGGGYYTYLMSEAVGADGVVYATAAELAARRQQEGDLRGRDNVRIVTSLADVPDGSLDAVLVNRAYHLIQNPDSTFFPELRRVMKPGGRVGIIEVRLGAPRGHDMRTHRMGEETVREEMERGGFRLVARSEILSNPEDPRTDFMEGRRHLADRMFLIFEAPSGGASDEAGEAPPEDDPPTPSAARELRERPA